MNEIDKETKLNIVDQKIEACKNTIYSLELDAIIANKVGNKQNASAAEGQLKEVMLSLDEFRIIKAGLNGTKSKD